MSTENARFCSHCGAALAADSGDADPLFGPPTTYVVDRRVFGVPPPELLCGLGAAGLVAAIALLAAGRWIAGAVVAVLALMFAGMFVCMAERFPQSRTAQAAVATRRVVRGRLVVSGVWLAGWTHAAGEIVRLAWTRRRLRSEFDAEIARLGAAVYADDPDLAAYLKAEAHATGEKLEELQRHRTEVTRDVRQRIDCAKDTTTPTVVLKAE